MNKFLGSLALGTAIVAGGAVALPPTLASAQDTTQDDSSTTELDDSTRPAPFSEALDALVADGTLTQAQADAVLAALEAHRPADGMGGPGGRVGRGADLDTAAEVLGVDIDTLRESLQSGDSLADVAAANGVDVQTLIDSLVADANTRLDEAVADGRLTEDEAATRADEIVERITAMVNGEVPVGGPHGHGPGGPRDGADDAVQGSSDSTTSATDGEPA
ncbi:MAG: hypothetical protein KDB21_11490 [Acidimicrobiales bacterium]|nr:hypothetical protein [Acidimicrobiales bacterium]